MTERKTHFIGQTQARNHGIMIKDDGSSCPAIGMTTDGGKTFSGGQFNYAVHGTLRQLGEGLIAAAIKLENGTLFAEKDKEIRKVIMVDGVAYVPRD